MIYSILFKYKVFAKIPELLKKSYTLQYWEHPHFMPLQDLFVLCISEGVTAVARATIPANTEDNYGKCTYSEFAFF